MLCQLKTASRINPAGIGSDYYTQTTESHVTSHVQSNFLLNASSTIEEMFLIMMLYFPVNILFLLILVDTSHAMMITISKVSGQDNASCIKNPPSHSCQTLDYVVSNI